MVSDDWADAALPAPTTSMQASAASDVRLHSIEHESSRRARQLHHRFCRRRWIVYCACRGQIAKANSSLRFGMPEKMSVGLVSRTFFNVPLWAAMENGRFAAEGIEVAPIILGSVVAGAAAARRQPAGGDRLAGVRHAECGGGRPAAPDRGQCRQARAFADRACAVQADRRFARRHHRHPQHEGRHVLPHQDDAGGARAQLSRGLQGDGDRRRAAATQGAARRHDRRRAAIGAVEFRRRGRRHEQPRQCHRLRAGLAVRLDQCQCRMGGRESRSAGALPADVAARHRMALCQPRGGIRGRRARDARAARPCAAGVGPFHRHQCAHPRHGGQHQRARPRHCDAAAIRAPAGGIAHRSRLSTSTAAISKRRARASAGVPCCPGVRRRIDKRGAAAFRTIEPPDR